MEPFRFSSRETWFFRPPLLFYQPTSKKRLMFWFQGLRLGGCPLLAQDILEISIDTGYLLALLLLLADLCSAAVIIA